MLALQWWREVLAMDLCQARPWADKARPRATLFADASGQPPCVAAVLVTATGIRFTSMVVPDSLMASFQRRRDNQIQGLELLSIALGMCTFAGIAFACDCPRRRAGPAPRLRCAQGKCKVATCIFTATIPARSLACGRAPRNPSTTRASSTPCGGARWSSTLTSRFSACPRLRIWPICLLGAPVRAARCCGLAAGAACRRGGDELLLRIGAVRTRPWLDEEFWHADAWGALSVARLFG